MLMNIKRTQKQYVPALVRQRPRALRCTLISSLASTPANAEDSPSLSPRKSQSSARPFSASGVLTLPQQALLVRRLRELGHRRNGYVSILFTAAFIIAWPQLCSVTHRLGALG